MNETTNARLDRPSVEEVDLSDLLTDVLAIPEHLRDAQWKAESADLRGWDSEAALIAHLQSFDRSLPDLETWCRRRAP